LKDAEWNEKLAAGLLIVAIVAIGFAPFLLQELIGAGADTLMNNISAIVK
jgi:hypothetical protein